MRPFLAVFLPLLIGFATTLGWCVDRWNAPTQYFAHGWLVAPLAALVIWARRATWSTTLAVPDRRGFLLLGPGLLLHFAGALLMIDSLSAAGLCLAVPGAAWTALGRDRLRGLWPVLWLVLFAVPAPIYVEGHVAFALKELAVAGGTALANGLGADLARAGAALLLRGTEQSLYVADACGGLRSLLAMATIAWCLAFFTGPARARRRIVLLAAAVPIAVAANVVRIALLCLFARWFGVPFAEGLGHTLANGAEWLADLMALLLLDAWLSARAGPPAPAAAVPGPARGPADGPAPGRLAALRWALAVPLLPLSLWRPPGGAQGRAERLPAAVAGFQQVARSADEERQFRQSLPRWRELLGTPDFDWRQYRDADGVPVWLVALFHDANWKSVHAPRICIEGSDMDIEVDDEVAADWLGAGRSAGRIVARRAADGRPFVTLYVFGTAEWTAGSYGAFAWHHLPRAVVRANRSGFLLRAETPLRAGEDLAAAERRCAAFLAPLVIAAQEAVR